MLLRRADTAMYRTKGARDGRHVVYNRGEGKTDAKDAAIIVDQPRMRRDLRELRPEDSTIAKLRILTTHRADLAAERGRTISAAQA